MHLVKYSSFHSFIFFPFSFVLILFTRWFWIVLYFLSLGQKFQSSIYFKLILGLCWYLLHLLVRLVHLVSSLNQLLLSYIISTGLLRKYRNLWLENLNCLAIVVDSDEARDTTKIMQLLSWLSCINAKHITLYDMQGTLNIY